MRHLGTKGSRTQRKMPETLTYCTGSFPNLSLVSPFSDKKPRRDE